jgi:hypothetical protein
MNSLTQAVTQGFSLAEVVGFLAPFLAVVFFAEAEGERFVAIVFWLLSKVS